MNHHDRILLAASKLDGEFTAEQLVVKAWKLFPRTYGLSGFEDLYPDSNKPLSYVMGQKGLVTRCWLKKLRPKVYSVTMAGLNRLAYLEECEKRKQPTIPPAKYQENIFLNRLVNSEAYRKYQDGSFNKDVTFRDACEFWGAGNPPDLEPVFETIHALTEMEENYPAKGKLITTGQIVTAGDLRNLTHCHRWLDNRFRPHLKLLKNRKQTA